MGVIKKRGGRRGRKKANNNNKKKALTQPLDVLLSNMSCSL